MQENIIENENLQEDLQEKNKKHFTIYGVEFVYLFLLSIGMAFLGWVAENTVKLVSNGVIDSRFHIFPFLSPYMLVVFAYHILLRDPDDPAFFGKKLFKSIDTKRKAVSHVAMWLMMCGMVFVGEFVIGNLWEILFGVQLWCYTTPFTLTQYAGLFQALGYGTGAYVIFVFLYKPALRFVTEKVPFKTAKTIDIVLGSLILLDSLFMFICIIFFHQAPMYWTIKFW